MITWYKDKDLIIEFTKEPEVGVSYAHPYYGDRKNKKLLEKCFILKTELQVFIKYKNSCYIVPFDMGYTWDGATIPRMFWRVIGANTDPQFLIASMLHDRLCEKKEYINNDRYLSTLILERCLKVGGVGSFKRWLMKHSVDNYQKLVGGWK